MISHRLYQCMCLLAGVVGWSLAYPGYPSQRFFYQVPAHPQLLAHQPFPHLPSLVYQNHQGPLIPSQAGQPQRVDGVRPGGNLVYVVQNQEGEGGGEGGAAGGGGYVDTIWNLFGSYWPGQQSTEAPATSGGEEAPVGETPIKTLTSPVVKPETLSEEDKKPSQVVGSKKVPAGYLMGPAVRAPSTQFYPYHQQQQQFQPQQQFQQQFLQHPAFLSAHPLSHSQQDESFDSFEGNNFLQARPGSAAMSFQKMLAAARLKAAQAGYKAAQAQEEAAIEEHQPSGNDKEEQGNNNNNSSEDTESTDQSQFGPSIAQAKPQAVSVAGPGGVAAAAPVGTAVVGPGGMALSAPHATAVAGAGPKRPPSSPAASSEEKLVRTAQRHHPSYYLAY